MTSSFCLAPHAPDEAFIASFSLVFLFALVLGIEEWRRFRVTVAPEEYGYPLPPLLEPLHPLHIGKIESELRSDPLQSRYKRVTAAVTKWQGPARRVFYRYREEPPGSEFLWMFSAHHVIHGTGVFQARFSRHMPLL